MTKFNPALLARAAVESYVNTGEMIKTPDNIPEEFKKQSGVFVSIKKGTDLRGCIGTIEPQTDNIAAEIVRNAISAAVRDPRFKPVSTDEIGDLSFSVDVLGPREPVKALDELDPDKYGVIVKSGAASGLLLPDIAGVNTVQSQIAIAKQKAGIFPGSKIDIFRFSVERFFENYE